MEFDSDISLLSTTFIQAYPTEQYPELMHKQERPYTCLLVDSHEDYLICVPFRSSIEHKNAFMFTGTARSKKSKSGLDYSKIVIIKNATYLDSAIHATVDQDEYNELQKNLSTITYEALNYVNTYINHCNNTLPLHPSAYERRYRFSTLPYFHKEIGLQ